MSPSDQDRINAVARIMGERNEALAENAELKRKAKMEFGDLIEENARLREALSIVKACRTGDMRRGSYLEKAVLTAEAALADKNGEDTDGWL